VFHHAQKIAARTQFRRRGLAHSTRARQIRRRGDIQPSPQALAVLRKTWSPSEDHDLAFPSNRSPMKRPSKMAMNSALRRMGYMQDEMTAHRLQSSVSIIHHEHKINRDDTESSSGYLDEYGII
jgi:hypothetical protein